MFIKPRKNRQYSYTPQFYNPEKETEETGRRPIRFRRGHSSGGSKTGRSIIRVVLLFGVILYLLQLLSQLGQ